MNRIICFCLFLSLFTIPVTAQTEFGDIKMSDFKPQNCPVDNDAAAYYIFDNGETYFETYSGHGNTVNYILKHKRHFRIHVLKEEGLSQADLEIMLYKDGSEKETIKAIKAATYNLEDGWVSKTKLSRKEIIEEDVNENWRAKKAALSSVKKGSIIEVSYTIESPFIFKLKTWYFQKDIPVLNSLFRVEIPEYFHFHQFIWGYHPVDQLEKDTRRLALNTTGSNYDTRNYEYSSKNILGFPDESHIKSKEDYKLRIEFELSFYKFPGRELVNFSSDWNAVNEKLLSLERFGGQFRRSNYLEEYIEELNVNALSSTDKIHRIYDQVKNDYQWNEEMRVFTSSNLKEIFKEKIGNSADLNLLLLMMLRESGVDADPVLVSSHTNGFVPKSFPSIANFNYVIVRAKSESGDFLLDATSKNSSLNVLPVRCLNGEGLVVKKGETEWVSLFQGNKYKVSELYTYKLNTDLSAEASCEIKTEGYAAMLLNNLIDENRGNVSTGLNREEYSIVSSDSMHVVTKRNLEEVSFEYTESTNDFAEELEGMYYFKCVPEPFIKQNPFTSQERIYPVDFNYPLKISQFFVYEVPEGYQLAEAPERMILALADNAGRCIFQVDQIGGKIKVTLLIDINQLQFLPEDYEYLKQFYELILSKQEEYIVLEKI